MRTPPNRGGRPGRRLFLGQIKDQRAYDMRWLVLARDLSDQPPGCLTGRPS